MQNQIKYFLYARKSTDDPKRQVLSIEAQQYELKNLARRENITLAGEFEESKTAKCPGRPEFAKMLERIRKGDANAILCWKIDRLARNLIDAGEIINLLQQGIIKEIRSHDRVFLPSDNVLYMLVEFGMANQYIRDLSTNVKRGIREKLRKGIWPTNAPIGYLNDRATRTIVIDPARGPLVRKAFELYATGDYSFERVREMVNGMGLMGMPRKGKTRALATSNYQSMLENPIYYGTIRYLGEHFEGKHEPLISKSLFDAVQDAVTEKSKPKSSGFKPYVYRGLFHCGTCGCFITTETQKGHHYLRCTKRKGPCGEPYVREESIHEQISRSIERVAIPERVADGMLHCLEMEREILDLEARTGVKAIKSKITERDAMLDNLLGLLLRHTISEGEYCSKKELLVKEKAEMYQKMTLLESKGDARFEPVTEFVNSLKKAAFLAKSADYEQNRLFLKKIGSNLLLTHKTISVSLRNPWKIVSEFNSSPTGQAAQNENFSESLKWRREGDSNPRYEVNRTTV
jgi:site-specific DNA recombinase